MGCAVLILRTIAVMIDYIGLSAGDYMWVRIKGFKTCYISCCILFNRPWLLRLGLAYLPFCLPLGGQRVRISHRQKVHEVR